MSRCLTQDSSFLVLNKKSAWDRGLPVNLEVTDDGLKIREISEYVLDKEDEIEVLSEVFEVTDFAVADCGQLYILDAKSPAIWVYDTKQKLIEKIDCLSSLLKEPTSIAYVPGTLYVADRKSENRIIALSDQNWQIKAAIGAFPRRDALSLSGEFQPVDLAVDEEGNLFALDQSGAAILKFNEAFQLAEILTTAELQARDREAGAAEAAEREEPNYLLASAPGGMLYVLDPVTEKVLKLQAGEAETIIEFQSLKNTGTLPKEFKPGGFALDNDGNLFVGDASDRRLDQEDDRFIREFDAAGSYVGVVADFRGRADRLTVDRNDSIFIFRKEQKKITALRREPHFAQFANASLVKGHYISKALDSRAAGTVWHKLISTTERSPDAQIQISFLAEDEMIKIGKSGLDLDSFIEATAKLDPRGQSDIENNLAQLDALNWSTPIVNSDDSLIDAVGRYLWVRIILVGNERESPSFQSLRLEYPRVSYLRYLPSVYQENPQSRAFLERFLSLFETFFAGIENQVDHIARYFDPEAAVSEDFLAWLSKWLAISVDNNWDQARLRLLVRQAAQIYKQRGTRSAIEQMVEIFTGARPIIVEQHQLSCDSWSPEQQQLECEEMKGLYRRLYGADSIADENLFEQSFVLHKLFARLYGTDPLCFCVLLKPSLAAQTEEQYQAVRRLLDSEKPAHTCAGLLALQPWIQLDTHTYLDVNTYLSEPSARLDLGSAIPRDTVLDDDESAGQLEWHSRIDLDMTLI